MRAGAHIALMERNPTVLSMTFAKKALLIGSLLAVGTGMSASAADRLWPPLAADRIWPQRLGPARRHCPDTSPRHCHIDNYVNMLVI